MIAMALGSCHTPLLNKHKLPVPSYLAKEEMSPCVCLPSRKNRDTGLKRVFITFFIFLPRSRPAIKQRPLSRYNKGIKQKRST